MEEKQDADVDDVDRESLVKEIELIRQTLGGASNRAQQSDVAFVSYHDRSTEKDSDDDSEDELAIIKSPGYQESTDEISGAKHVPVEVISSESEDEILETTPKNRTPQTNVSRDTEFSAAGNISYEISAIVPLNNETDEVELFLRPVAEAPDSSCEDTRASSEKHEALPSPRQSNSLQNEQQSADYTLAELQQVVNGEEFPPRDLEISSLGIPDHNANIESSVVSTNAGKRLSDEEEEPSLSDEEDSEDLSEQQRCLKLNRKYQTIIEAQLRKIEKLIVENRQQQFALNQMTSSTLSKAEKFDFRHVSSYSNPYFRVTRREHPDDNEDTKLRQSLGQPHPFEKRPSIWKPEDRKILEDAVRSEVLQAKLTPLLQKVETFKRRKPMTEEDEKELDTVQKEIDHLKALPLSVLVEDFTETIDFEDISNKMLPSRTAHQCQVFWYNELHPLLNKGKWTKEEDKLLLQLATENSDGGRWDKIACELKSNRSPAQCLRRYQKSLNTNFLKSKWDPEEDRKLIEAIEICGVGNWENASSFLDGRTGAQCMHRYNNSLAPNIKRGKWAKEEDCLVRKGVELYGFNWTRFKNLLPTRTVSQIRERWQDVLDPKLNKSEWTKEEDQRLLKVVEEQGVELKNWTIIAKHMNGRTDNRCRRRWFYLNKNDPKAKEHLTKQKFSRAKLVNNFSRRHADKPDIGPDDFVITEVSETEKSAVADNGAEVVLDGALPDDGSADGIATRTRNAKREKKCSPSKSPKKATTTTTTTTTTTRDSSSAQSPKKDAENNKAGGPTKLSGAQKRKRTRSSKSPKKSEISISDKLETKKKLRSLSKKKLKTGEDFPSPATPTVPSPSKTKKASKRPLKKTKKPKLTAPSPTVVSQASALPNAMPMSYLTQFSVLLQAFHVDVSGVLKNVNSPQRPTTSEAISNITTAVTTSASLPTTIMTVAQTPSQAVGTGRFEELHRSMSNTSQQAVSISGSDENNDVSSTEAINTIETHIRDTSSLSKGDITEPVPNVKEKYVKESKSVEEAKSLQGIVPAIAPTQVISNSQNGSISQKIGAVSRDRNNVTIELSDLDTAEPTTDFVRPTAISNASKVMTSSAQEVFDSSNCKKNADESTLTSEIEVTLPVSNGHTDTSNTLSKRSDKASILEGDATSTLHKRKRKDAEDLYRNGEKKKRINGENDKETVDRTRKALEEKTSASGKDKSSANGVVLSGTRYGLNHEIVVFPSSPSPAGQSEESLKLGGTPKRKQNADRFTTPAKKQRKTSNDGISGENTNRRSNLDDIEQVVTSPRRYPRRSNRGHQEVDDSVSERVSRDLNTSERESIQIERVRLTSTDVTLPRVPAIPLLPPSTTTLNAFKKLLTLRKSLQSQANCLVSTQAVMERPDQNVQSSNQSPSRTTPIQNPIADRLLLVSNTQEAMHGEFRNSIPYQQLLNRFKGLFMWPGFLSIVNPSFVKQSPAPSSETPKKKKKRKRESR